MKHTIRIQPTAGGYSTLEFSNREEAAQAFETLEKIGYDGTFELHLAADDPRDTNLETDCAPSYAVECTGMHGRRFQWPCDSLGKAPRTLAMMRENEGNSGPYHILETRVIHSEP